MSQPPPPSEPPPPYQQQPPQSQQPPPYQQPLPSRLSPAEERTWGMLAHVSAIIAAAIALSFLGPLIVMLVQGQKSDFVRRQSVEALNFQITTYIAALVSAILIFVLIGLILLVVVGIGWLVLSIMAAVAANRGEDYRYPVNLRLIK